MPGGDKNIRPSDNPKPFKKGASGNPNGRPKKLLTQFKGQGYKAEEVREVMSFVLTMTKEERAKHLTDNPDGLETLCIRSLERAIAKGDYSKMRDVIDIVVGGKKVDISTGGEPLNVTFSKRKK